MPAKFDSVRNSLPFVACPHNLVFFFLFLALFPGSAQAQIHNVLCTDGVGTFAAALFTKVRVRVGATRKGMFATRSCEATLSWENQHLTVASDIPMLDLDAFGVDLGLGSPLAAFQLKKSKDDCCMTYQIYSLRKPPRLLRTLTGGSYFEAADTDLDGRVEIWTEDTAAFAGFDNLSLAELDFAPPLTLRFEKDKVLDVSPEFAAEFDKKIEKLRSGMSAEDLCDFKDSDGKLQSMDASAAMRIHRLRGIKVKVLEIVWSYLYSGREQEAWDSLAQMWPSADAGRIRGLLLKARASGMARQLDGVSTQGLAAQRRPAKIYTPSSSTPGVTQRLGSEDPLQVDESLPSSSIAAAVPIMVRSFPTVDVTAPTLPHGEMTMILVIDAAGKVRSAQPIGTTQWPNIDVMSALSEWKFVPAFNGHHPVASTMVKIFSLQQ